MEFKSPTSPVFCIGRQVLYQWCHYASAPLKIPPSGAGEGNVPGRLLRVGSFSINDEHKIFEESQHKKDPNELLGHPHISFYFIQLLVWRNMAGRASKGFGLDATRMNILPLFPPSMCPLAQGGRSCVAFLSEVVMVQIPAARKKCQGRGGLLCACHLNQHPFPHRPVTLYYILWF